MRAIDLFSGPGGLTLGMKAAGATPLLAVEKRREAAETYRRHTPEAEHHCGDVRTVDFARYRGAARLLYGGPPCQPFSTGGLRKGSGDARDMVPAFLGAVEAVQPEAVLMENVPGLIVPARVGVLHDLLASLQLLGYATSWRVLNAAHYGVPQSRQRLFVVGLRGRAFRFPRPTHGPGTDWNLVPASSVVSLDTPIGEPPDCPVMYAKAPDTRPSPYAGHVYNGGGRPIDLARPCPTILASAGGYKTHWVDVQGIAPDYHRHLRAGGDPWEGAVPGARRLTVEESALLQTFPSWLTFAGARSAQYTQVGDAVPPLLAEALARSLVQQMEGDVPDDARHLAPLASTGSLFDA